MTDNEYMLRAVELAKRGIGAVNPNPLVGAVITRDGQILAEGWHARCGELHAERNAIKIFMKSIPKGILRAPQSMSRSSPAVTTERHRHARRQSWKMVLGES